MISARDYNAAQLQSGHLTLDHITALVRAWQAQHGLAADGMAGPATIASIEAAQRPSPFLSCPLPVLADGRRAVITSGFRPADRPDHNGCDWFYPWHTGDQPSTVGDHGAEGRNADGSPRWVVPTGVRALSAADGVVSHAAPSPTGHVVWIDHGNGLRSGYFHLLDSGRAVGERIAAGATVGLVGDNPIDKDGRHLHFELSPVGVYAPMDPEPYMLR